MGGWLLVDNYWNGLADLIANLITKYAVVLDLDNLLNPTLVNNIEDKNRFDIAKIQMSIIFENVLKKFIY